MNCYVVEGVQVLVAAVEKDEAASSD